MTPGARIAAAVDCLDRILAGAAAEKVLTGWARASRFAGSGDRAMVRDHVFEALRCRRSFAALGGAETGRGLMIGRLRAAGQDPAALFTGVGHAPAQLSATEAAFRPAALSPAVAADLPDWLWALFRRDLGAEAPAVAEALRARAPVFLRVNLARIGRAEARARLAAEGIFCAEHPEVATALVVEEGARRIEGSSAYREGLVELQDASSQAAVLRLELRDGMRVLDYCAGGGGKALAMGALARLDLVAHDADPRRMRDLPARAARAGLAVRQVTGEALAREAPMDLVLVDAPCSGSGTWRRTPDAKWRLGPEDLTRLTGLQAGILAQAAGFVGAGGVLAYATCSVLADENRAQARRFVEAHPRWRQVDEMQRLPGPEGDGFYLAQFWAD